MRQRPRNPLPPRHQQQGACGGVAVGEVYKKSCLQTSSKSKPAAATRCHPLGVVTVVDSGSGVGSPAVHGIGHV
ncbi:hypothetical protein E2562_024330 [Oryza meyeriana var. granulata]|uniref:Uncharacterized protein n=1 Tax=Oryza meyeriana var. granulata TaxID=110450 RepID=A0A6G1C8Z5_9ORYZ|nr:hypothetical protein E2562_024330 [Oryza meyeriana var. granulata]